MELASIRDRLVDARLVGFSNAGSERALAKTGKSQIGKRLPASAN